MTSWHQRYLNDQAAGFMNRPIPQRRAQLLLLHHAMKEARSVRRKAPGNYKSTKTWFEIFEEINFFAEAAGEELDWKNPNVHNKAVSGLKNGRFTGLIWCFLAWLSFYHSNIAKELYDDLGLEFSAYTGPNPLKEDEELKATVSAAFCISSFCVATWPAFPSRPIRTTIRSKNTIASSVTFPCLARDRLLPRTITYPQ